MRRSDGLCVDFALLARRGTRCPSWSSDFAR